MAKKTPLRMAQDAISHYAPAFGLMDWEIAVQAISGPSEAYADVTPYPATRQAQINVYTDEISTAEARNPADGITRWVIHELAHVALSECYEGIGEDVINGAEFCAFEERAADMIRRLVERLDK